ncbi:amidohydrolase family protein [Gordonia terrae]
MAQAPSREPSARERANRPDSVIDAWVQPWPADAVAAMPRRNLEMAERFGQHRLLEGIDIDVMIQEMDASGIDVALCSAGPLIPNAAVVDAVARHPDRLIGVGSVNPWNPDGVMSAVRELRALTEDHGFVGLKLEPFILDKAPTEAQWYPLYAACADLDITVQIQVGGTGPSTYTSETGRPGHVDRVAIDFPELRIVAGHIGWPWTEEMIAIATKHANVWIDTSAHLPRYYPDAFVHFLKTFGRRKCIWASDWPVLDFEAPLTGVDGLELRDDVRQAFLRDNVLDAFALRD